MAPVVYVGSIGMFRAEWTPIRSTPRGDAVPHPGNHYGVYKLANEGTARVYWADSGIPSVGLRPMTVYGAGRDQGMTSGPTVAIAAAVLETPFRIAFGGSTLFQYAEDVARTLLLASRADPAGARVFNLGGSAVSIEAWIDAIEEAVPGARQLLTFEPDRCPSRPISSTPRSRHSARCRSRRTATRSPRPRASTRRWPRKDGWSEATTAYRIPTPPPDRLRRRRRPDPAALPIHVDLLEVEQSAPEAALAPATDDPAGTISRPGCDAAVAGFGAGRDTRRRYQQIVNGVIGVCRCGRSPAGWR